MVNGQDCNGLRERVLGMGNGFSYRTGQYLTEDDALFIQNERS